MTGRSLTTGIPVLLLCACATPPEKPTGSGFLGDPAVYATPHSPHVEFCRSGSQPQTLPGRPYILGGTPNIAVCHRVLPVLVTFGLRNPHYPSTVKVGMGSSMLNADPINHVDSKWHERDSHEQRRCVGSSVRGAPREVCGEPTDH